MPSVYKDKKSPYLGPTRNLIRRTERILLIVENAPVGVRNARLYWAACRLGEIVAEGKLRREVAERLLLSAAGLCGLTRDDGKEATKKTIDSGLNTWRAVEEDEMLPEGSATQQQGPDA